MFDQWPEVPPMLFTLLEGPIPARMTTDEFLLRPIIAADVELDYAAVMESREYLRPWEQTGWPADDFTLADDLEDVELLERRHAERQAFTYTVLTPDESECLGCVYVMPPDARSFTSSRITPVGDARWDDVGAAIYFWVRTSRLASGIDRRLLDAVRTWWAAEWSIERYVVVTNEEVTQQVGLLESTDLDVAFLIEKEGQSGAYLAYG